MNDELDDDIGTFGETINGEIGSGGHDTSLNPAGPHQDRQADNQSASHRLRKAVSVAVLGKFNGVNYAGRDRLALLVRGGVGAVGIAAFVAALADLIGIQSGPLWEFQVFVDRLLLQTLGYIGDGIVLLADIPQLTLLVILALVGLGALRL